MAVAWHCIGDKPLREAKMTQFANAYEHIKTSWHRNVFRAICILQGVSTAHRWIPLAAGQQHKHEVSFSLTQINCESWFSYDVAVMFDIQRGLARGNAEVTHDHK